MSPEAVLQLTPHSTDLYYGRTINHHIAESSAEWIIIRDLDTMYLTSDAMDRVYDAIADHPDAALMTCLTNRVANQQFTIADLFDETDITKHIAAAKAISSRREYREVEGIMPGYFWLFPRSTWNNNPFDDHKIVHNNYSFDVRWTQKIKGKKIIILSLLIFHLYRLNRKHRYDVDHLEM